VTIYSRAAGATFNIVIEGKPGLSHLFVGTSSYQPDLSDFPDLQVEVSQQLGDGSAAVCDNSGLAPGGVPAIDPPSFDPTQTNINAVNDFACRFVDGSNLPKGRSAAESCVKLLPSEDYGFVCDGSNPACPSGNAVSTIQFCALIDRVLQLQPGDTVVTARLRDTGGNVGPSEQIVIHSGP
jgi:hypothetical protein